MHILKNIETNSDEARSYFVSEFRVNICINWPKIRSMFGAVGIPPFVKLLMTEWKRPF